jgi:methyltransferase
VAFFWGFLGVVVLQRLTELWVAHRHTRQVRAEGGYEVGRAHYPWIVCTHGLFFLSLVAEVHYGAKGPDDGLPFWLSLYVLAQIVRYWAICSLGRYWNTRVFVVPGMRRVTRGPYRYIRHPNYVAVVTELFVVPMMFGAYITAVVFSIANAVILCYRIPAEEAALREAAAAGR